MKKTLCFTLSLILVILSFSPSFADSSSDDLYKQSGKILESAGVLKGSEHGDLMLNQKLKRQDMVVLISRLLKQEDKAKKHKVDITFKDIKNSYYKPFISWAVDEGLIIGKNSNTFGFDENVTIQQLQTLLLRTLGYEEETKDWDNVPILAEALGIMTNISDSPSTSVKRGLMACMTVNTLRLSKKGTTVTLAEFLHIDIPAPFTVTASPTILKDSLKLEGIATGTDDLQVQIEPISKGISLKENLIDVSLKSDGRFNIDIPNLPSGEYKYRFVNGIYSTEYKKFDIEEPPFELIDVQATNLKEIAISFSKPVDKTSCFYTSNYYTDAGQIKKVRLEDNDKKIVLTLDEDVLMKKDKTYKLSIYKITSLKGEDLSLDERKFVASDTEYPKVENIKPLGKKMIKIYFSEPIMSPKSSNFKIDGRRTIGSTSTEGNTVILKLYSSLSEGEYTLTTSGLKDYAGYKSLEEDNLFGIIDDTDAPEIVDARATLDEVIVTFDEDIDPKSISRKYFYWKKSGSIKRYTSSIKVDGEQIILDFSSNTLPNREVTLYVDGIKDYFGNKVKDEEIEVTPVVDTTNPKIINVNTSKDGKSINIFYSKNVKGDSRTYYTIKNENGRKINIKEISGSGREYTLKLYTPLPKGKNTLTIEGVKDTTSLKNTLSKYETTIDMKDVSRPKILSHSGVGRQIMIQFSKEMNIDTLTDPRNYLLKFDNETIFMPEDVEFNPLNEGKTLIIMLPFEIDNKDVKVGDSKNIKELKMMRLQDTSGNLLEPDVVSLSFSYNTTGKASLKNYYENQYGHGVLIEPDVVKIRFTQPIVEASKDDFKVRGRSLYDVNVDGTDVVTLELDSSSETTDSSMTISIKSDNEMETMLETGVRPGTVSIIDKLKPRVEDDTEYLDVRGDTIEIPFTESLEKEGESLYRRDLEIVRLSDGYTLNESEYSTYLKRTDSSKLIISIDDPEERSSYMVRIKQDPQYIRDRDGNVVEESSDFYTEKDIY